MSQATAEPSRDVTFPIAYQVFAGSAYNPDFKGRGSLTIRPDRPSYLTC
jgi:hypothetical protein